MKIGCCIPISWYDTLVQNGYGTIALAAKDVAAWDDAQLQAAKQKLDTGLLKTISLNSFCTPELKMLGSAYCPDKLAAYAELVCKRAQFLGFRYIGIGAPGSRNLQPGDDRAACLTQFKDALSLVCRIAAKYQIDILLESVCTLECNFITTTREALALLRELSIDNLHLVYDIYHEYMEKQALEVIADAAGEIRVVHIAQDKAGARAYLDAAHITEYQAYWTALKDAGYDGEWNLECFVGDPAAELPQSMDIMKKLI